MDNETNRGDSVERFKESEGGPYVRHSDFLTVQADNKALLDALKERRTVGGSHLGCIVGPSKDYRCDMCKRTDAAIEHSEPQ